jgi:hypothetical protein
MIARKYNQPPVRYNPVSPYPQYTKFQLDMRRKAEILSYNAAKTNTKTNNPTKKEIWSALAKGQVSLYSQSQIAQLGTSQQNCNVLPTPSSSCDVPGHFTCMQVKNQIQELLMKKIINYGIIISIPIHYFMMEYKMIY